MMATVKVDSVDQMIISFDHAPSHFERSAGLPKSKPGYLERLHHCIMDIELSCAPLICLVVWTILFEGVDRKDGLAEAELKFINFDNLTQHLANVFMIWIDFYLNDLSVVTSHFLLMFGWMLTYTLFHSVVWVKTCFLAYPFMNLATPWVFLWFVGISSLHGMFYYVSMCCSKRKRRAMDEAHGIDSSIMSSGSSAGSIQDGQTGDGGSGGGRYGSMVLMSDEKESMYSQWSRGVYEEEQRWGSKANSSSYLMSQ
jgi:hypothetical protein